MATLLVLMLLENRSALWRLFTDKSGTLKSDPKLAHCFLKLLEGKVSLLDWGDLLHLWNDFEHLSFHHRTSCRENATILHNDSLLLPNLLYQFRGHFRLVLLQSTQKRARWNHIRIQRRQLWHLQILYSRVKNYKIKLTSEVKVTSLIFSVEGGVLGLLNGGSASRNLGWWHQSKN